MNENPTPSQRTSDASSLTQSSEISENKTTLPPPEEPQSQSEEDGPTAKQKWIGRGKSALVWAWKFFAELVTIVWLVALWDSYRPKITITPGGTLNSKSPFGTYFIIQNQGSLPISKITYLTHLYAVNPTNQAEFISAEQNVSIISQMKSMESYTFPIRYQSVQINPQPTVETTNSAAPLNQKPDMKRINVAAFLISFDVSYDPKFFGKRTDTLYFYGVPDVDGNWQWLPSAHQRVTEQTIDTNLLIQIQKMNAAPIVEPTNGSTQIHTNQSKPH